MSKKQIAVASLPMGFADQVMDL